jgi:5-methylcytosine-specific restriction endonuclease McrA
MILAKPSKREPRQKRSIRRRTTPAMKRHQAKAAGWVDPDSWAEVIRFYGGRCAYDCLRPWQQQDHCKPLSRGGEHTIGNVVPSCSRHNMEKGTRTLFPRRRHPFMRGAN